MKRILPLIIITLVAATFFLAVNSSWAKGDEGENSFEQAYVVEEINLEGEVLNIYKGNSFFESEREIAIDLGANPYKEDRFGSVPKISMGLGSVIKLYRAPRYTVIDGNRKLEFRSWQESVGELLKEKDIVLGKEDKINFATSFKLEPEMEIKIIRVAKTEVVEQESIDYKVIEREDPDLERGKTRVEQYGEEGVRELTYEVIRENGEEISKTLIKSEVAKEPVSKILIVGTKIISYGTGKASWYIDTSSMIGACNILPKGTKVRVVNLYNGKSVTVTVSGGGLRNDRIIDLSTAAFEALGATLGQGIISNVRLEKVY